MPHKKEKNITINSSSVFMEKQDGCILSHKSKKMNSMINEPVMIEVPENENKCVPYASKGLFALPASPKRKRQYIKLMERKRKNLKQPYIRSRLLVPENLDLQQLIADNLQGKL